MIFPRFGVPLDICRKCVERVMREAGLQWQVKPQARFVVTTDSDHDVPVAPNLLQPEFSASAPTPRGVIDITYVATDEGWLYIAAIIDLFSRRVVGWEMQDRTRN